MHSLASRAAVLLEALPESVLLLDDTQAFNSLLFLILHGILEQQLLTGQVPSGSNGNRIWKVINSTDINKVLQLSQTSFTDQFVAEVHRIRCCSYSLVPS